MGGGGGQTNREKKADRELIMDRTMHIAVTLQHPFSITHSSISFFAALAILILIQEKIY